jgi:glycosyltransferase involved in cell wall biosynthesis
MVGNFGLTKKGTMRARALPLARALVRRGHAVTVLLPATDEPANDFTDAGVAVRYIDAPGAGLLRAGLIALGLVRAAFALRPDIVHTFKPISLAGLVAAAFAVRARLGLGSTRLVVDTDDWEGSGGWATFEGRPDWLRLLVDRQERWTLRQAAAVTVASRHLERLVRQLGVADARLRYLPNGAEFASGPRDESLRRETRARLGLAEAAKVVLLYTRFFEYPVERVVEVFQRVAVAVPEAVLLVVGRGFRSEEERMAEHLAERGLDRRTVFAGWASDGETPAYFAAADLAIYPLSDTLINRTKCPAKLVELMAAGVPVVAEAVGQANEYVAGGESGVLVPPDEPATFADTVISLLANDRLRLALGVGGASRVERLFLWDRLANTAEEAYGLTGGGSTRRDAAYV